MKKQVVVNKKIEKICSLTPMQEGMLFHNIIDTSTTDYVLQNVVNIKKDIPDTVIRDALKLLEMRYEVLRTAFIYDKIEKPRQVILKEREIEYNVISISSDSQKYQDEKNAIIEKDLNRGFNLQKDTLLRITKLVSENRVSIIWTMHHIIVDGWCMQMLIDRFVGFCNQLLAGAVLEDLKLLVLREVKGEFHYSDYIKLISEKNQNEAKEYWSELLSDYSNVADINPIRKPASCKDQMHKKDIMITGAKAASVFDTIKECGVTINAFFESVCGVALQRYNNTDDVVFGKVVSGRNVDIVGVESMVGLFINTIPTRVSIDNATTVRELLQKQQEQGIKSTEMGYMSLADVQALSGAGQDLIKVLYAFENYMSGSEKEKESEDPFHDLFEVESFREQTNYEISILGFQVGEELRYEIMYNPNVFVEDEIKAILDKLVKLSEEFTSNLDRKVLEIEDISNAEKQIVLEDFNNTTAQYPKTKTVVSLFEEQVMKNPDRIAVKYEGEQLTYTELNEKANQVAHRLRECGVKPNDFVPILAERGVEIIVGILGVLKSGAAFVPIDPSYPQSRIQFMMNDCDAVAVVTYKTEVPELKKQITEVDLCDSALYSEAKMNPLSVNVPSDNSYCIYTSGTTGEPKGVVLHHKGQINMAYDTIVRANITEDDQVLMFANYIFDASIWEISIALLSGACLNIANRDKVLDTKEFSKYCEENKISVTLLPPNFFINTEDVKFRVLVTGGSEASVDVVKSADCEKYINAYGPTEGTVYATCWEYNKEEEIPSVIPIGKPIANTNVYIVNNGLLCGIGIPGELCISGDGIAKGYLNREELTNEKFVSNPFGEGVLYKTGDLARWLPDGNVEYLGRIDEQVKIRGYRVELGEIEARIRELDGVKDCAVIAKADSSNDKAIYAYYVSDASIDPSEIHNQLSVGLPSYMLPAYLMQIDQIPITKNGKLDKRALPDITAKIKSQYVEPRTPEEETICKIFSEILNVEKVGIKDNFFELGGHSLRATRLVNKIEAELGVRVELKKIFSNSTPESIAKLIAENDDAEYEMIPIAEVKAYYPMSSTQKRTYLLNQLDKDGVSYNIPASMKLKVEVLPEELKLAMEKMIERHEILRTAFLEIDDEFVQKIEKNVEPDFVYVEETQQSDIELLREFIQPFDLGKASQLRIKLVKKTGYSLLLFDMHHIISDGFSMNLFQDELLRIYKGEILAPLTHQYKDYSEWMLQRDLSEQKKYWMSQFEDVPVLDMPFDYIRPKEQSFEGKMVYTTTSNELKEQIKKVSAQTGATDYMILLSAAMVLLNKYSRQEDIVIGSPISARTHKDTENMLGMFANTLAMRGNIQANHTYLELLKQIKDVCLKSYENQEYPFDELVEALNLERDFSRNPLFDVMLVFQNNERKKMDFGEMDFDSVFEENTVSKFDMTFNIFEEEEGYLINLEYCTKLFEEESAQLILQHYVMILENLMHNVNMLIKDVSLLAEDEKETVTKTFNQTEATYPRTKTVVELFQECVERNADKKALVFEGCELTYRELNEKANQIAHKLREMNVGADDLVAIITERGLEMLEGIFAIIKAGGAYLPIDPTYPAERVKYILEDSKPKAVITFKADVYDDILGELNVELPRIEMETTDFSSYSKENPVLINQAKDLLYCIYTSGTTGNPKGVLVQNRTIVNLVSYEYDTMEENTFEQTLFATSFCFDVSAQEYFSTLLSGGTGYIISFENKQDVRMCLEAVEKNKIKTLFATPSYFESLVAENVSVITKNIQTVILAGEQFKLTKQIIDLAEAGNIKMYNHYGPTESHVVTVDYAPISELAKDKVMTIGKPIANSQIYILDQDILCGVGVPGELCIAGDCVARGYLNQPQLTADKFVQNPFGEGKMYKTGDLARWLPDGNIECLGRIDEQVKIRGYRIELGEIESRLRDIKDIKDCAVIVREDSEKNKEICAYFVSDIEQNCAQIREELGKTMPSYMLPAYMMQIEKIPVTKNGKLDRRALPVIEGKIRNEYVEPRTNEESIICGIFSEILDVDKVGITDNFFELGGHSLRATRLVNRIEAELGVRIELKKVFNNSTPESLASLVMEADGKGYEPIPMAQKKEFYPMSSTQKRTFLLNQLDKNSTTYNMPAGLVVDGVVEPDVLKDALQKMIERHEILRTAFYEINGELVQKVEENVKADFSIVEENSMSDAELLDSFVKPFDLGTPSLLRVKLVKKEKKTLMLFDMHHIISDGFSMNLFQKELMCLCAGQSLEPLSHQYKDYSEWMNARDISDQKQYWLDQFQDIPVLDMPLDFARPAEQSFEGNRILMPIGSALENQVRKIAEKTGATEYMIYLSAVMLLLGKYSRQEEVVVGSPMSARVHKDTESMLGMFVNTLAMRGNMKADMQYVDFLNDIKQTCLKAYENQEYPFEELVEELNIHRDFSRNPLFDVMFVLQNNEKDQLKFGDMSMEEISYEGCISKFDMTFSVDNTENGYVLGLEYCNKLFKHSTAERMMKHFLQLLTNITKDIHVVIKDINFITEEERIQILGDFNDTDSGIDQRKSVVAFLEEQVSKTPDQIALVFEDQKLTYKELNARANQVAYELRKQGVHGEDYVAIIAEKNLETIIGICGIVKAGGVYVPIDSTYPISRIQYILEDCQPKVVLSCESDVYEITQNYMEINLRNDALRENPTDDMQLDISSEDLIYCIYTSGTTGNPKGSVIEHKSVTRLVIQSNYIDLDESTVMLQTGSMSFDAATLEIWGALLNGGTLVIANTEDITDNEKLKQVIKDNQVNTMWMTSTLFNQMIMLDNSIFDSLKHLLIGGEKLSDDHVRMFKDRKNGVKLTNGYGPTENTTFTTTYEIPDDFESIPIGKPISNTQVYILDNNNLCGIGVPGELCTTGDGVSRGYLNKPDYTAEKFVKNPFGAGKMYRTGDLARWLPDGNIDYLGRIDNQVKIRGFRIELGEIESRLREVDDIKDCAVIVRMNDMNEKSIYAYVVGENSIDCKQVRKQMERTMPSYMIPSYMMQIDKIPVTKNGKLDQRSLPVIETQLENDYVAPRTEEEKLICGIFEEILNAKQIGVTDNFFENGGDSIKAIRIISKLRAAGYSAAVKDVMTATTADKLALLIKKEKPKREYEQGEVTGVVPKTPILNAFDSWNLKKIQHFNQAIMVSVDGIADDTLKKSMQHLIMHHDMLRAVYCDGTLEIKSSQNRELFDFYAFDLTEEENVKAAVEEQCAKIQASIDLENGPLVKVATFSTRDEKIMMIAIHHLAVDGVSWRVIQEDMETLIGQIEKNEDIKLPRKTASFIEWSNALKQYKDSDKVQSQKAYWNQVNDQVCQARLMEKDCDRFSGYNSVKISIPESITERLIGEAGRAYNSSMNELLLSALARGIYQWRGLSRIAINMEGHGREMIDETLDIDRTVGWFTCMYPAILECHDSVADNILSTKNVFQEVIDNGIGYGLVIENNVNRPDITFNYLGDFGMREENQSDKYSCGDYISQENKLNSYISINGEAANNILTFTITYDRECFSGEEMKAFGDCFEESISEVTKHCLEVKRNKASEDEWMDDFADSKLPIVSITNIYDSVVEKGEVSSQATILLEEIDKYDKRNQTTIEASYMPSDVQKFFIGEKENLAHGILNFENIESEDKIVNALKMVIREQSALRTALGENSDEVFEVAYKDDWYIPVIDETEYKAADRDCMQMTFRRDLLNSRTMQSYGILIKKPASKYRLYVYINHAFYDRFSTEVLKDRMEYYLTSKDSEGNTKSFSSYQKKQQELLKQETASYEKKLAEMTSKAGTYFTHVGEQKFTHQITLKVGMDLAMQERFDSNSMESIVKMFVHLNPYLESCEDIPYVVLHSGRNEENRDLIGATINYVLGLYNMRTNQNIGGLEDRESGAYNHYLLNNVVGDENIHGVVSINFHLFGIEEANSENYVESQLQTIDEVLSSKYEIFAYFSDGCYVLQLPILESSYEYVSGLKNEELLEVVKKSIM